MAKRAMLLAMGVCVAVAGGLAAQQTMMKPHVTSADAVKFTPLDPKSPDGVQVSVIAGELMGKGPVTFFMKLPKGKADMHSHTAGYHATVIRGQAKHWLPGEDAKAETLGPGSHWYEPGKRVHGDECVSTDCLLLLTVEGGFDYIPAQK